MSKDCYIILDWLIEPQLNRISHKHSTVQLEPRTMRLLVYLIEHVSEVVSREQIFNAIWPNMSVSDESLTRSISDLRKALGDNPQQPQIIETIRKTGYRLVAPVRITTQAKQSVVSTLKQHTFVTAALSVLVMVVIFFILWPPMSTTPALIAPTDVHPFTSDGGLEFFPAFSHDGRKVAYNRTEFSHKRQSVLVVNFLDDKKRDFLIKGLPRKHPAWSVDDTKIAYYQLANNQCDIFIMDVASQRETKLASCPGARPSQLLWTPGGEQLLVNAQHPDTHLWRLWLVNVNDPSNVEPVELGKTGRGLLSPRFSKNGNKLAYVDLITDDGLIKELSPIKGELKVINWPSRVPIVNLTIDRELLGFDWESTDQSLIYAGSDDGNNYQLLNIDFSGTEKAIYASDDALRNPVISRQGKMLFESWNSNKNINIWHIGQRQLRQAIQSSRWDFEPSYSSAQTHIIYVSTRTGNTQIWYRDLKSGTDLQLTSGKSVYSHPQLSLDNQQVLFVASNANETHLYIMGIDGEVTQQLTHLPGKQMLPHWSVNGKFVYFTSDHSGQSQIWRINIDNKSIERVTASGGYSSKEVLFNGKKALYYIHPLSKQLWVKDLDTSKERQIGTDFVPSFSGWDIHQNTFYWLNHKRGGIELHSKNLETQKQTTIPIKESEMQRHLMSLDISPDGSELAFTAVEYLNGDLMFADR